MEDHPDLWFVDFLKKRQKPFSSENFHQILEHNLDVSIAFESSLTFPFSQEELIPSCNHPLQPLIWVNVLIFPRWGRSGLSLWKGFICKVWDKKAFVSEVGGWSPHSTERWWPGWVTWCVTMGKYFPADRPVCFLSLKAVFSKPEHNYNEQHSYIGFWGKYVIRKVWSTQPWQWGRG